MTCPSAAKKSYGSHLFGVFPGQADKTTLVQELSKAITFFVLGPILVKFHIRTRLTKSFLTTYRSWKSAEEKSHFTPVHTLCQLKRDKALFPPFRRVVEFKRGTVRKLHAGLGGGPNLDSVQLTVEEK